MLLKCLMNWARCRQNPFGNMRRPSGPSYEGYHLERRDSRGRKVYVSEHFSLVAATRFEEQDSQ